MGCASDVGTAFKNIEGVTAHDVRPNKPVKLGASRELTKEELAKALPSKYGITEFKVVK